MGEYLYNMPHVIRCQILFTPRANKYLLAWAFFIVLPDPLAVLVFLVGFEIDLDELDRVRPFVDSVDDELLPQSS